MKAPLIGVFVCLINLACAETERQLKPSSPGQKERIVIGNLVLEDVDMSNPEEQEKVEKIRSRVEPLLESMRNWKSKDMSDVPTEDLFLRAKSELYCGTPSLSYRDVFDEIARRPDESQALIRSKIFRSGLGIEDFNYLLAISFGMERKFYIEAVKECLFHPDMIKFDTWYIGQEQIFHMLATSDENETPVLDRLIAEGRMEKGSHLETKWRKKFAKSGAGLRQSGGERPDKINRGYRPAPEPGRAGGEPTESRSFRLPFVIGGILSVAILAFLIRARFRSRLS